MRGPSNWRRLQQLAALAEASGGMARTESGGWVTTDPAIVRQILLDAPERYADQSAFLRVDQDVQLQAGVRRGVLRAMLGMLADRVPRDWAPLADQAGASAVLELPGWGVLFLRRALAGAIGLDRDPALARLVDTFVQANLVRTNIKGHIGLRKSRRIRALRAEVGPFIGPSDVASTPRDLVDVVAGVRDLSQDQRGELFLRLITSLIGATGIALEWALIALASRGAAVTDDQIPLLVSEAQRLNPVSWIIPRQAIADHRLGAHRIATGDSVTILTFALHRTASVWADPAAFDLSRWIGAEPERETYVPFSLGRTTCPGRNIALRIVGDAAAAFASRYEIAHRQSPGATPNVRTLFAPPDGELVLARRTALVTA